MDWEILNAQGRLLECRSVEALLLETRRLGAELTDADDVEVALLRMDKPGEPGSIVFYSGNTAYTGEQVAYLEENSHLHPIFPIAVNGGLPTPMTPEDVVGRQAWTSSGIFAEVNRPCAIERSLFATMEVIPGFVLWIEAVRHKNLAYRDLARQRLTVLQHLACGLLRRCDHLATLCRLCESERATNGTPVNDLSWRALRLTGREAEVLRWVEAGKQDAEIAIILDVNARTVQTHVSALLRKLRCENRLQLIATRFSHFVELPEAAAC